MDCYCIYESWQQIVYVSNFWHGRSIWASAVNGKKPHLYPFRQDCRFWPKWLKYVQSYKQLKKKNLTGKVKKDLGIVVRSLLCMWTQTSSNNQGDITLETGRVLGGAESLTTWMCVAGTFLFWDAPKNADKQCCWWEGIEVLCSGVWMVI